MLEEQLRQAEEDRATATTKTLLDVDPRHDADVQPLQKNLACVERKVDKQEYQTLTKIKSLCADANTKEALVAELRRTLATTRTELEALRVVVNALCSQLATERDATEQLRVNSMRLELLHTELALERTAVADHKKEVCAFSRQLKDARQRYEDNCDNLLTDLDNANLDADKLVDFM